MIQPKRLLWMLTVSAGLPREILSSCKKWESTQSDSTIMPPLLLPFKRDMAPTKIHAISLIIPPTWLSCGIYTLLLVFALLLAIFWVHMPWGPEGTLMRGQIMRIPCNANA